MTEENVSDQHEAFVKCSALMKEINEEVLKMDRATFIIYVSTVEKNHMEVLTMKNDQTKGIQACEK